MPDNSEAILTRIREHAYASLSARAKQNTNLYLDSRIYKKRETIGPEFQQIAAPKGQHSGLRRRLTAGELWP